MGPSRFFAALRMTRMHGSQGKWPHTSRQATICWPRHELQLEYDPNYKCLLLVAGRYGQQTQSAAISNWSTVTASTPRKPIWSS